MAAVASSASWAPSSPRLSFSRDFVQSEVFSPSPAPSSRVVYCDAGDASPDFDFGMLALLRMGDPDAGTPMLPADELFSNGRLIAKGLPAQKSPAAVGMAAAAATKQQVQQPEQHRDPPHASQSSPITTSNRWRELFGRHRATRLSLSEMEQPLTAASAMAAASSSPSSASSVSSSAIKCTRLKLLFRSSSASGGLSRRHSSEPSLGRSASESKASCCSCCTARRPLPVLGPTNAAAPATPPPACSASRVLPLPKQQSAARRRSLSETSYQKLGQTTSAPRRPSGKKAADGWKAYTNSSDRVASGSSSASSSSSSGGAKVAQVLHMDVCMGQSMVVSKVTKAFVRKDSRSL